MFGENLWKGRDRADRAQLVWRRSDMRREQRPSESNMEE